MNFERMVIGSLITDNYAVQGVMRLVSPADFGNPDYAECLRCIFDMSEQGQPIDVFTLSDALSNPKYLCNLSLDDLISILDNTASAANVEHYAERIRDEKKRRTVQSIGNMANEAESGAQAVDDALKQLMELSKTDSKTQHHINDGLNAVIAKMELISNGGLTYIPTGFIDLDAQLNGFTGGKLYVVGARPSMGKTALALNMMDAAEKSGCNALFFTMEMTQEEITDRMVCAAGSLNTKAKFDMQEDDWGKLTAGFNIMKDRNIMIDDGSGHNIQYMKNTIRTHAAKNENPIYFIDYLQLMRINGESRVQGIGEITREFKSLSKEVNAPIVLLSQLSRALEQRPDKRPVMADLRESGEIEQDADVIMFIYRDEVYNENSEAKGITEILVRKNRQGETGKVLLKTELQFARFNNLKYEGGY